MVGPRQILLRGLGIGLLASVLGAAAFLAYVGWYSSTDRVIPGVRIGRAEVGGLPAARVRERLAELATLQGGQGARLRLQGQQWEVDPRAVGAAVDQEQALAQALALGRQGPLLSRARHFLVGWVHGHVVQPEPRFREEEIARRLAEIAAQVARAPRDARYELEADQVLPEESGVELDVQATLEAIRKSVAAGSGEVDLVTREVAPAVRADQLQQVRQHRIASFATPILSADAGRVQNISMAVNKISGVVLQPGQIFSFNSVVGPRDAEHGWAKAAELYQGEFVMGYGGGICQVSSTLYNSVLLAGLKVAERYHHERPLQYIQPGRDATVAWEVLDFRFQNSSDVPVMLGARVLPGKPQQIEVSLYGPRPVPQGQIRLETAELKYLPPDLEEVLDPTLPADAREVVDEGYDGIEVQLYRVIRSGTKERRELVSHDHYRPKSGKVRVGVGNAPGSERLLAPGIR